MRWPPSRRHPHEHPRRPILGFTSPRHEVSGTRLWGWARAPFGAPARFFARFFVANYCPLCFLEASGANRTPDKLPAAERAYKDLNLRALRLLAHDGVLVTCSCSQQVDAEAFERLLAGAAQDARRRLQILEVRSMGADHPLPPGFPEGRYLKCVFTRVTDD